MYILLLAQICFCNIQPASTVVLNNSGECIYWYWDAESDKHNPCINVPDNAKPILIGDTDEHR